MGTRENSKIGGEREREMARMIIEKTEKKVIRMFGLGWAGCFYSVC